MARLERELAARAFWAINGGMRRDYAVAAARPYHRHLRHLAGRARAVLPEHAPERLVGEESCEIVHAAVALGLADHRDHIVRRMFSAGDVE